MPNLHDARPNAWLRSAAAMSTWASKGPLLCVCLAAMSLCTVVAAPGSFEALDREGVAFADDGRQSPAGLCLLQDAKARGIRANLWPHRGPVTCDAAGSASFTSAMGRQAPYWRNKNGDAAATGASRFSTGVNVSNGPSWSFKDETKDVVLAHPVIDADKGIYLMHRNGMLRKFSPEGRTVWANRDFYGGQDRQSLVGGPVIMDGALFVTDLLGNAIAVDAASGATRWTTRIGASCSKDAPSLAGLAGTVLAMVRSRNFTVVPDNGGQDVVVAMDARDGHVLWRRKLPGGQWVENTLMSFADEPPSVLFANRHGVPYRWRLCDGSDVWEAPPPSPLEDGEIPAFATGGLAQGPNGIAYVSSNFNSAAGEAFGRLSAYRTSTGELIWSRRLGTQVNNAPAVGRLGGPAGGLSVVIGLGNIAWYPSPELDAAGVWPDGSPISWKTELAAYDAATGEPTGWRYVPPAHNKTGSEGDSLEPGGHSCLPDPWSNAAIDVDGTVYIGHLSGNLFGLRDVNGDGVLSEASGEVMKYYGARCYQASPAIAEGMLVATPCDGMHVFAPGPAS